MAIFMQGSGDGQKTPQSPTSCPVSQSTEQPQFRLCNAKQNEYYQQSIEVSSEFGLLEQQSIEIVEVQFPETLALIYDQQTQQISGIPLTHGDFDIKIIYRVSADTQQQQLETLAAQQTTPVSFSTQIRLYVNPDPRALWLNVPSDPVDPFYKADVETKLFPLPLAITDVMSNAQDKRPSEKTKTILAGRIRGRSHAHIGSFCDDDFFVNRLATTGWHIAIVADGAGSAKYSRKGSALAVQAAGQYLTKMLNNESAQRDLLLAIDNYLAVEKTVTNLEQDHDSAKVSEASADLIQHHSTEFVSSKTKLENSLLLNEVINLTGQAAKQAIDALDLFIDSQQAVQQSIKFNDLYTTLLITISKPIGDQWFVASYAVGDGAICIYQQGKSCLLLGSHDSGEFAGQTHFLTHHQVMPDVLQQRCQFAIIDSFTAILAMTDGISDVKFATDQQMAEVEYWDALWQTLSSEVLNQPNVEQSLTTWLNFWSRGHHDDRTLAIIY